MSNETVLEPKFGQFRNSKPVFGDQKKFQKSDIFELFLILSMLGPKGHPALRV